MTTIRDLAESAGFGLRTYSGSSATAGMSSPTSRPRHVRPYIPRVLACEDTDDPAEAVRVMSEALRVAKTDQMGTGRILYFPGIKYEEDESEGEA